MDKDLLEYEMKKNKINVRNMCDILKISRSAFYRKCNGITEFTKSEIESIAQVLGLDATIKIFFASEVS